MTEVEKPRATRLEVLADRINKHHRDFGTAVGRALNHARLAGKLLIQAKHQGKHGEWLPWLEANFEGSERVAQMYMRVATRWEEIEANTKSVSDLTLSEALKSISPLKGVEGTREPIGGELTRTTTEIPVTRREPGVIEQLQASPEGAKALAQINQDFTEGQARDRIRAKISDLRWSMREVAPKEVARDVIAAHVGEKARAAVLERSTPYGVGDIDLENAQEVHAWLEKYLRTLREADMHLRTLAATKTPQDE